MTDWLTQQAWATGQHSRWKQDTHMDDFTQMPCVQQKHRLDHNINNGPLLMMKRVKFYTEYRQSLECSAVGVYSKKMPHHLSVIKFLQHSQPWLQCANVTPQAAPYPHMPHHGKLMQENFACLSVDRLCTLPALEMRAQSVVHSKLTLVGELSLSVVYIDKK